MAEINDKGVSVSAKDLLPKPEKKDREERKEKDEPKPEKKRGEVRFFKKKDYELRAVHMHSSFFHFFPDSVQKKIQIFISFL